MKCPHCGQEHPDTFKFCPNTAKALPQLKACTNKQCSDFGKHILPIDSKFCPTCGSSIDGITDSSEVFLSFFDITLGETNIYDIEADKYIKSGSPLFGGQKLITVQDVILQGNNVMLSAMQSDKKVFAILIHNEIELALPDDWISVGVKSKDVLLSMERVLGRNNFEWTGFGETAGIAYKEIRDNTYILIVALDDSLMVMQLTKEMKNVAYKHLYEDLEKTHKQIYEARIGFMQKSDTASSDETTGRYRWQTESFQKIVENDRRAERQREQQRLEKEKGKYEESQRNIERFRRKHGN